MISIQKVDENDEEKSGDKESKDKSEESEETEESDDKVSDYDMEFSDKGDGDDNDTISSHSDNENNLLTRVISEMKASQIGSQVLGINQSEVFDFDKNFDTLLDQRSQS